MKTLYRSMRLQRAESSQESNKTGIEFDNEMNLILFLILVAGLIHHTGIKQNRVKLNKKRFICHNDKIVLLSTICFL